MQAGFDEQEEQSKIAAGILQAVSNVARLRSPTQGCVWFRRQTFQSLRRYLLEEVYEVLSPLDAEAPDMLQEELGDLLFQIVVLSQLASERGWFSLADVLQRLNEKVMHRNPHVFGERQAGTKEEVQNIWKDTKTVEKTGCGHPAADLFDGLSTTMPALALAQAYLERSGISAGDWNHPEPSLILEMEASLVSQADGMEAGMGRLLFLLVDLANRHQLDPEAALQKANARFRQRFGEQFCKPLKEPQT